MKQPKRLSAEELFAWSVKKLAARAVSEGEIRAALLARALESADIEPVVTRLKDYGYLNDARFAESFASARLENEGLGQSRVLRDLRRRRVAPDLARTTVAKTYAGQDESALIEQFLQRKYRSAAREGWLQTRNDLARAYARLLRAGFTPANSLSVLKRFGANPDLLDEMENTPPEPDEQ